MIKNKNIKKANVENAQESTRLLAQTSLRNVLGQKSLSEILSEREAVSRAMRECLDEATDPWVGIDIIICIVYKIFSNPSCRFNKTT